MLKRLELVGFKSFADKTQFDFADGVTGIIGPNGSGKSNVVDAVRWVLGEQSARSLRGGEMTDVIFNGSASRKSTGMAEVSMVFDNRRRVLATDGEEVRITRRVYRSGEGEYLINNQPCRLKDVKDLFLGSGAGTDAYCIIQQGQVDVLLQTAPKERRTIFEEAAGISRFKAKKTETLRRLERVDGDLQRVRDILEEKEKQLRSVRLQASKAERYREYTGLLRELRIGLSLREYHTLEGNLQRESAALAAMKAALERDDAQTDTRERELLELEQNLSHLELFIREQEGQLAMARRDIGIEQTRLENGWNAVHDLELERGRCRKRLAELVLTLSSLGQDCARARAEVEEAESQTRRQRQANEKFLADVAAAEERLLELRAESERQKEHQFEQMRQVAHCHNVAAEYKAELDNLLRERNRERQRSEKAAGDIASLDGELEGFAGEEERVQAALAEAREQQGALRTERDRLGDLREELTRETADLRAERSGLVNRIEVLENLERSHEGLSTGTREVLQHLESPTPGPWSTIAGIVAELFTVRREFAPLIDLALGDRAQRFIVRDLDLLGQALRQRGKPFSGRVSFLHLSPAPDPASRQPREAASLVHGKTGWGQAGTAVHPGVIALAEQLVRCEDPRFADLPARLLGKTLIVHDLTAARAIHGLGAGFRCITLAGELLEADGTLTVGTHHAEAGILSRKSELRELRERLRNLDPQLAALDQDIEELRQRLSGLDARIEQAGNQISVLAEQAADWRWRITQHQQKLQGLNDEVSDSQTVMASLEQEIDRLETCWHQAREDENNACLNAKAAERQLDEISREIRQHETQRTRLQQEGTASQVALAQFEERSASRRQRLQQLEANLAERERERSRLEAQHAEAEQRWNENLLALLRSGNQLAEGHVVKEDAERHLRRANEERSGFQARREKLNEQVQANRSTWRQQQEQAHAQELAVTELRHTREKLCQPLQQDYQIDLEAVHREQVEAGRAEELEQPLPARAVAEKEEPLTPEDAIPELRRRINKLGNVNPEAIEELAVLEAEYSTLEIQFKDLTASQQTLQEIISRINTDSRRLFTETFETVRGHFQELFRKLFGGGMADIILEQGADVLEGGIEINARPPGKELRSISLMSGGEKTMTAVALLLAIFRSKPSPFCILDEVDAALDEANVGRFTAVLRDFLGLSQFIIITHHKRTMSAADVLYGVTMQESGISSRFSVRFEDWPDDDEQKAA